VIIQFIKFKNIDRPPAGVKLIVIKPVSIPFRFHLFQDLFKPFQCFVKVFLGVNGCIAGVHRNNAVTVIMEIEKVFNRKFDESLPGCQIVAGGGIPKIAYCLCAAEIESETGAETLQPPDDTGFFEQIVETAVEVIGFPVDTVIESRRSDPPSSRHLRWVSSLTLRPRIIKNWLR